MAIFFQTKELINPKPNLRGNSEVKDTTSNVKHFIIEITFFLSYWHNLFWAVDLSLH